MRVFVAGATGVIGQYLVPGLISAGHDVTASTRSPAKASRLKDQGATPVIVDGLDRQAVLKAVTAAQPEVIIHQMTALTSMRGFRHFDKEFAVTNELRSKGTDYLLQAATQAGTRRFIDVSKVWPSSFRAPGAVHGAPAGTFLTSAPSRACAWPVSTSTSGLILGISPL